MTILSQPSQQNKSAFFNTTIKKAVFIAVLILSLVILDQPPLQADISAAAGITLTNPAGPITLGEAQDYATWAWNNPWDMSDDLDIRQLDSPHCVYPNHFNLISPCSDGLWCGQVRSDVSNPDLFLLFPGYQGGMHVGRDGNLRPINANTYTQLTFRMYIDSIPAGDPGLQVYWTNGTVADIGGNSSRYGGSSFFKTYSGWHIYTIDLSKQTSPLNGALPWSGNITGLRLDPGATNMNNRFIQFDWVRLTPAQSRPIQWSTSESGNITIKLQNGSSTDDLLVYTTGSTPISISASANSYNIPASLPPGDWYVQLEVNGQSSAVAGPWQIQAVPTVQFVSPSFTSGTDYALSELGNAWDMSEATDIYQSSGMTTPSFSGGQLSATSLDTNSNNSCSPVWEDPYINLLNDHVWEGTYSPAINTGKYRYLTFKLKVDGVPDISYGWVSRMAWSNADVTGGFKVCGITNDIPLHSGWNEVTLDLWDTTIMDETDSCKNTWQATTQRNQIRFDPFEVPTATTFHIDNISLTANDTATQGDFYTIRYLLSKTGVTPTFYYDTDTTSSNGRNLAIKYTPSTSSGSNFVYLPIIQKSGGQTPVESDTFPWDLNGVPTGTYYISVDLNDGYQTVTWYSESPMIITSP